MRSARPPALLVLVVLLLHGWGAHELQRLQDGWARSAPPMPERLQVALVREMQLQAPPARTNVAAAAVPVRTAAATTAGRPASTPQPPASAPEPVASAPAAPALAEAVAASAPLADAPASSALAASAVTTQVAAAASAPASAAEGEPGPEWPLSTRLSYQLTGNYRGPITGQAQVEWLRQGRRYQVNLDVQIGPSFAPLITRRMSSQGLLGAAGIAPQRYDEETRLIFGDPRRQTVLFLGDQVQLPSGAREPALRGGQDAASQFVQLTWLFLTGREPLQAGHVVQLPLVLPRKQYAWQYEVLGEEVLYTRLGQINTWHLKPSRPAGGGDLTAEVWLAPSLQYLPVRLQIRQSEDNYVDMTLRSLPLQAAPESASQPH